MNLSQMHHGTGMFTYMDGLNLWYIDLAKYSSPIEAVGINL